MSSSRLSRVLFRDNDWDDDLMSSEVGAVAGQINEGPHIISEDEAYTTTTPDPFDEQQDADMSGSTSGPHADLAAGDALARTPKKTWSEDLHPSSPFTRDPVTKSRREPRQSFSLCSSPSSTTLRRSVRQLQLFGSPKTPKIAKRSRFPGDGDGSLKTPVPRSSLSRGLKRSAHSVNINPFTPSGMLLKQQGMNKRQKTTTLDGYVCEACEMTQYDAMPNLT